MRTSTRQDIGLMDIRSNRDRLDTPSSVGYRAGMSSCGMIGRKLSTLYAVPSDCPDRMEHLLEEIDRTAASRR